jgi:hypothetical protein
MLSFTPLAQQALALLLQILDLQLALGQQQFQVSQPQLGCLAPGHGLCRVLAKLRRVLSCLVFDRRYSFALGS